MLDEYQKYVVENQNFEKDIKEHIVNLPDLTTLPKAGEYVRVYMPWLRQSRVARVATTGVNWIWETKKDGNSANEFNEFINDGDKWTYINE